MADELVDNPSPGTDPAAELDRVAAMVDVVFAGGTPDDPVLVALADTVRRYGIARELFDAFLASMRHGPRPRRVRDLRRAGRVHVRLGRGDRAADAAGVRHGRAARRRRAGCDRARRGVPADQLPARRRRGPRPRPAYLPPAELAAFGVYRALLEARPVRTRGSGGAGVLRRADAGGVPAGRSRGSLAAPRIAAVRADGVDAVRRHPRRDRRAGLRRPDAARGGAEVAAAGGRAPPFAAVWARETFRAGRRLRS